MASPTVDFIAFAQSIYLVIKNRYFDDITGEDGLVYLSQVADWTNMFLDELETETNPDGEPIDWKFARQLGASLGTATVGATTIDLDSTTAYLLADENRYVQITQDGAVISNWAVVAPSNITNKTDRITEDMVTSVGGTLMFSREFKDTEDGGDIIGDIAGLIPRIVFNSTSGQATNVKALSLVKPALLLKLGVAKNATLPDIVQGGLSPSYVQKYNSLLSGAIARNDQSSRGDTIVRDDYSFISGVGF